MIMREKFSIKVLKAIKMVSESQAELPVKNKCVWFGYEPKVPNLVKEKKAEKNSNDLNKWGFTAF